MMTRVATAYMVMRREDGPRHVGAVVIDRERET
jgi:hypothetical protein